jgi:hypothetical protein
MRRPSVWAAALLAVLALACEAPPNKEMDQAQGALDAARAAGAEQYATEEYAAAAGALRRSQEAVAARDYRLALNHAIDSRERAQNAARTAADAKAQVRGEVERTMAELAPALADAHARLSAAEKGRTPRRVTRRAADALAAVNAEVQAVNAEVQKAGEATQSGDYLAAQKTLVGLRDRISAALAELDAPQPAAPTRRR